MKFFVDTADVPAIAELNALGMVDGVTTNPSLILKSGRDILEVTKEICSIVSGPVSAEVVALTADAFEDDRRACLEAGMDDHIAKPVDPERLRRMTDAIAHRGPDGSGARHARAAAPRDARPSGAGERRPLSPPHRHHRVGDRGAFRAAHAHLQGLGPRAQDDSVSPAAAISPG